MKKLTGLELEVAKTLSANRARLTKWQDFRNTQEFSERIAAGYWQGFWNLYKELKNA